MDESLQHLYLPGDKSTYALPVWLEMHQARLGAPSHAHSWPEPQAHEPRASPGAEEGVWASPWTVLPQPAPPGGRCTVPGPASPPGGQAARQQISLICSALSTYYAQCPLEHRGCRTGGICPPGKEETLGLGTTIWGAQAGRARAQATGYSPRGRRALARDGPRGDGDGRGAILPQGRPGCRPDSWEF